MAENPFTDEDGNPLARAILPETFKSKGSEFVQVFRKDRVAIYRLTSLAHGTVHFETVLVQAHDGRVIHGVEVKPAEFYPSTASWGLSGWTYRTRAAADDRARSLLARFERREKEKMAESSSRETAKIDGPVRRRVPPVSEGIANSANA